MSMDGFHCDCDHDPVLRGKHDNRPCPIHGEKGKAEWDRLAARAESAESALQELVEAARRLTSHTCDLPFDSCREVKKFRASADRAEGKGE